MLESIASSGKAIDNLGHAVGSEVLLQTAGAVAGGSSLETVARPFLDVLHRLTGLESTYLTRVDAAADEQTILFSDNRGSISIPEALTVPWQEGLCYRSLASGLRSTSDVERDLPGSAAARAMGLRSYASVPVLSAEGTLMGTLCGASGQSREVPAEVLEVMAMLAQLIADQWQSDKRHSEAVRRADEAESRLKERATFLAVAEHKLMSPLALLRGWSQFLSDDWQGMPPDVRSEALQTMKEAARDAVEQVKELLAEARSDVLSLHLDPVPVVVAELLRQVARQLEKSAGHDQVVSSHAEGLAEVLADRDALWQVLWHLGENAVKYSPKGGLIEFDLQTPEPSTVVLVVRDEGLGVPLDIDLFAPFTRGSDERMADISGTGLGLHIVQNLVQAMGGSVVAARRADRGSEFRVTLPRTR